MLGYIYKYVCVQTKDFANQITFCSSASISVINHVAVVLSYSSDFHLNFSPLT